MSDNTIVNHKGSRTTYGFTLQGKVYTISHGSTHGLVWENGEVKGHISVDAMRSLWDNNKDHFTFERLWPYYTKDGSVDWLCHREYMDRKNKDWEEEKRNAPPIPF